MEITPQGWSPVDETPKRHILDTNRVDWYITCASTRLGASCRLDQGNTNFKKKTHRPERKPRIWGAPTPEPIVMKFGLSRDLDDVIKCANFGVDRLRGF